ncbi:MAG: macrocin O-methyltransferase [Porticoccaceae bacterium]|nr:macrocin O-methyltransferase [Porticoccaceae bacterium]
MKNLARLVRNALFPNDSRRLQSLMILKNYVIPEYRLVWPQMDWWHHAKFNHFLEKFGELPDGMNTQRRWMLVQLLRLTAGVPGDTAECGVYKGAGSWLICDFKKSNGIKGTHFLFDSFAGLSRPSSADGGFWAEGDLRVTEDEVVKNLGQFRDLVDVKKGWIPDRFKEVAENRFSFVHVDVDLEEPTRHSLEFFYERLNEGGVFVCDDYGFTTCPGVTRAINDFLSDKPESMIQLDSGGGFFIKGKKTFSAF